MLEDEEDAWYMAVDPGENKNSEEDEKISLTRRQLCQLLENAKASVTDDAINKELDRLQKLDEKRAITELDPAYRATMTIGRYEPHSLSESFHIRHNLEKALEPICLGDLTGIKKMLAAQAYCQDAIGNSLLQRNNVFGEDVKKLEPWIRLGLKALNQSRAAAEALNEMVNPSQVSFVRQQNNALQQQVNNGVSPCKMAKPQSKGINPSRVRGKIKKLSLSHQKISSNKLLEKEHYEKRLELRTKNAASRVDTPMESLGTIKRTQNKRGESKVEPECL